METAPLPCAQFIRRCLKPCSERNPPQDAHCPICTEEYDRSGHKALRVVVQPPAQCNHEFCQACLEKIFARRKTQDNTNLCPLCRAVWFKAEYESLSARSRRLTEEANEVLRASNFASAPSLFAGVPEGPAGETMSDSTGRDTNPILQPARTPRPYARTRQPRPSATQSPIVSGDTRYSGDWRTEPVFTHREFHAALAAGQAAAGQPEPPPTTSGPHTASHPTHPTPQPFQFGQQRTSTPFPAPPHRAQFNYPPDDSNSTRQAEQNRAAPPHAFQSLEFQRRSADLDAREARLTQREGEVRRMRQALERREQDFSAFCERGRQLFRGRGEGV